MDESGNHKQAEQRERIRWIVSILIPLLCALLSFCVIAKYTASPTMKINAHAIQSLDDKKTTALELTAAATAASAAITLIPGDAGTPIADKLADLSSYFLCCRFVLDSKKIWAGPLPVSWFCLGWLFIW